MPSDHPASREGYGDDWLDQERDIDPRPPVRGIPNAANLNTQQIPPIVERYQTPGPGPSSGIPQRDLELSKIEKQVEDIRAILKRGAVRPANLAESEIKSALFKIELSTSYLKEHSHG